MQFIKFSFFVLSLVFCNAPFAAEGGGGAAAASGAGAKMGAYSQRVSQINNLEDRIRDGRVEIEKIIIEKNSTESAEKKREIMEKLLEAHKNLKENIVEYNKVRAELKYRFPEKDKETDRRYLSLPEPTIEQMEKDVGIDERLSGFKRVVKKKYKVFEKSAEDKNEEAPTNRGERPADFDEPEKPKARLKLEK